MCDHGSGLLDCCWGSVCHLQGIAVIQGYQSADCIDMHGYYNGTQGEGWQEKVVGYLHSRSHRRPVPLSFFCALLLDIHRQRLADMSSAAGRFCLNPDVLDTLVEHAHEESLYTLLQVSKLFALVTLPRLYRNFPIRPDQPSTFLDLSFPDGSPAAWSKRSAWQHVRTLEVYTHGTDFCPGLKTLPSMPNLHTIHLAGGDRPVVMGKECQPHSCPLLAHYSTKPLEHLIIRKLHLLPPMSVRRLTMILRPCQLPFDPHGKALYSPATFSNLNDLEECDLVLWDERHDHRLEWIYHPSSTSFPRRWVGKGPAMTGYSENEEVDCARAGHQTFRTRGCAYCDMQGCVRYTPNVPKQLPGVVFALTRVTGVGKVRLWNIDRSMELFQWWDSRMTLEEGKEAVRREAKRGREERRLAQRVQGGGREDEEATHDRSIQQRNSTRNGENEGDGAKDDLEDDPHMGIHVEFGGARQWLEKLQREGRMDQITGEEAYWDELLKT